jgi:SAM-dependent methyltransferase
MLARARSRSAAAGGEVAARLELVEADIEGLSRDRLPAAEGGFGLAILALNSILLLAERGRQRRGLATMAGLLAPGGIAVVDCWLPAPEDLVRFDGRLSLEWLRTDPETGREVMKLAAAWYDGANRLVTLVTIFDEAAPGESPIRWTRSDAMRLLAADELIAHAEDAGLVVEQVAGDYDLSPIGPGADRAILVARRSGG